MKSYIRIHSTTPIFASNFPHLSVYLYTLFIKFTLFNIPVQSDSIPIKLIGIQGIFFKLYREVISTNFDLSSYEIIVNYHNSKTNCDNSTFHFFLSIRQQYTKDNRFNFIHRK